MPGDEQVQRIASAARVAGKSADVVIAHLAEVAGELQNITAFTDADGRTFGLRVDLPRDPDLARRGWTLGAGVTSSRALASLLVARKGAARVESALGSETGPARGLGGGFASVLVSGPATLADDLEILGALGVEGDVREDVTARLRCAIDDSGDLAPRTLRAIGFRGPEDDNTIFEIGRRAPESTVERIEQHARTLQIARWQLGVFDDLVGSPQSVRAILRPDVLVPGVVVVYGEQPMAAAQKLIVRLGVTYDAWLRFAEMCHLLRANVVRRVEITLGVERATASLGVDVT